MYVTNKELELDFQPPNLTSMLCECKIIRKPRGLKSRKNTSVCDNQVSTNVLLLLLNIFKA